MSKFELSKLTEHLTGIDEKLLEPIVRKAADDFYREVLNAAHDYLLENLDHNLGAEISMLRRENAEMRRDLYETNLRLGNASATHQMRIDAIDALNSRVSRTLSDRLAQGEG